LTALNHIAIVVALREELDALSAAVQTLAEPLRTRVRVSQGGIGLEAATKAAESAVLVPGLMLLCSSGFSGGCSEAAAVGTVVLADSICTLPPPTASFASYKIRPPVLVDEAAAKKARQALQAVGLPFHCGPLVVASTPVLQGADKRAVGLAFRALAVDMECGAVEQVARTHSIPFLALRAISDGVQDDLPEEIGEFLDQDGSVRLGKVTRFAFKHPKNVGVLLKLKDHAAKASAALTLAWQAVLPELLNDVS